MEAALLRRGAKFVAGIDEAGRGPIAGPVVAAAVILNRDCIPQGINDSKVLDSEFREELFLQIAATSCIAWCAIRAQEIDRMNIRQATLAAMTGAASCLAQKPDRVLIDGRDVPEALSSRSDAIVRGDAISVSIAAASIVAKVIRDRIMRRADLAFPGYGFASHMGYCTALHRERLRALGPCSLHRKSFAPVGELLAIEDGAPRSTHQ